ncbi:unnamed protein product [marine sediment metagenome]|uniref:Uncharacterized protein n=1 Tax=marine sediment metagenome TaxID=412755 RepID=X1P5T5_9ZZZZ
MARHLPNQRTKFLSRLDRLEAHLVKDSDFDNKVELYASLSRKNPVPVLLEPFSHEEPYSPGQNPVVLAAVHKIFKLTDKRGVLVVDRGL